MRMTQHQRPDLDVGGVSGDWSPPRPSSLRSQVAGLRSPSDLSCLLRPAHSHSGRPIHVTDHRASFNSFSASATQRVNLFGRPKKQDLDSFAWQRRLVPVMLLRYVSGTPVRWATSGPWHLPTQTPSFLTPSAVHRSAHQLYPLGASHPSPSRFPPSFLVCT